MSRLDGADPALRRLLGRRPLTELAAIAASHPAAVYLVGGALRDALLGRRPADLDVAVAAGLEDFVDAVAAASGRRPAAIGDDWRDTRRMRWRGLQVDFARLLGDIDEDLARRDFAINAMALRLPAPEPPDAAILDPHGGRQDLVERRVRCFDAAVLDEDPLRLLRAMRYVAVLPDFRVDDGTLVAIGARVESVGTVARERLQTEWQLLLAGQEWLRGLELAHDLGLTGPTLLPIDSLAPARAWDEAGQEVGLGTVTPRLAAVLYGSAAARRPGEAKTLLVERRWPAAMARLVARSASWAGDLGEVDEVELARRSVEDTDAARLAAALALSMAASRPQAAAAERLQRLAARAAEERPWVTGADLVAWGMPQGPEIGALLDEAWRGQVLRRWDDRQAARRWARHQVASEAGGR